MIVQIYEIQTPEEAGKCIDLGIDHIGTVILSSDKWRQPDIKETLRVSQGTPSKNSIIPLFQELEILCKVLDYYRPHFLHLCESLTDANGDKINMDKLIHLQIKIKERFPEVGIIRSIPIPADQSHSLFPTLNIAKELEPWSEYFLIDTWLGKEPVMGYIGITGQICDWKMAKSLVQQSKRPVILAGGLSPENVFSALMAVGPAGADSCTHTNKLDRTGNPIRFKKDFGRVKKFIEEVRRAEKEGESHLKKSFEKPTNFLLC
ncbi:MAG: hypothetical protein ABII26_04660 [Pseudomonadota bacterium]